MIITSGKAVDKAEDGLPRSHRHKALKRFDDEYLR